MVRLDDDLYRRMNATAHYRMKSMNAWIVDIIDDYAFSDEVIKYREDRDAEA